VREGRIRVFYAVPMSVHESCAHTRVCCSVGMPACVSCGSHHHSMRQGGVRAVLRLGLNALWERG